jgi:flagellar biosynthesis protein FlhG
MLNTISTQAQKLVSLTKRNKLQTKTQLLTITSGKGGVGKSTFCANIAYIIAQKGYKVCVLDADIGLANMQVLFNIKPKTTFFDYINSQTNLEDTILDTDEVNLKLIAGKSGYQYTQNNHTFTFSRLVEDILQLDRFDFLIVDTGAGLNEYVSEFLQISPNILAITTTDPSALTDLYALLKMVSIKKNKLMLCFNHTLKYDTGENITKSIVKLAIKNQLNRKFMVKYIGNIPEDKSISTTGRLRKLFSKELSSRGVSKQLSLIVDKLIMEIK